MRAELRDTIAAIATPPGAGALGIVRMSGPQAFAIASGLLGAEHDVTQQAPHTVRRARLLDPDSGQPLDDALCTVMRAPHSYTGEDAVELSCHGSPALLALVLERLCRAGARHAAPGEFTQRAFLNGRIDLARAEAVALLIEARTERAVMAAARALSGELAARLSRLRDELLDLIAALEVALDFPDDEVGIATEAAHASARRLASEVAAIERASRRGRRLDNGVTVAIVGRTNAGKSSLFNALVGCNRAIVSAAPGTTRDVIEATVEIAGVAVRLMDTAGLGVPHDAVDAEGMARSRAAMRESDVVLWVIDGSVAHDGDCVDAKGRPVLAIRSKADLPAHGLAPSIPGAVSTSAATGLGIEDVVEVIRKEILRLTDGAGQEEGAIAASARQHEAIGRLVRILDGASGALATAPTEVALVDLHEALGVVSALLGEEIGDDILDRVFSRFCVGK